MFVSTIGANGVIHRSPSEAAISYPFFDLGIVAHDDYYPIEFTDSDGIAFRAMSDFYCPATGIYFEFKSGHMNGLRTKTTADNAKERFDAALAEGFITKSNENKKLLDASWSASVPKFKAVQRQMAEAGRCVVLVFDKKPDAKTVGRLDRARVFWCVFGDEHWRKLMSFRTFARHGFRAEYVIKDYLFNAHGGINHALH